MAVMAVAGNAWAAGNSGAAQACQQGGYLAVGAQYGMTFKNTGDCVSYFAHTNKAAACSVTPTTGCLTFDNVVLTNSYTNETVTLNASYSFVDTCNDIESSSNHCADALSADSPNNPLATGGGTYTVTDINGNVLEQGTLTAGNNPAAEYQGLAYADYATSDGVTAASSCATAAAREVFVLSSTGVTSDPYVLAGVSSVPGSTNLAAFSTIDGMQFEGPSAGATIAC